jgi:hypothetical protein
MAGQLPLETRYYPNDFHVTTILVTPGTTAQFIPIQHFDRISVIDSIVMYFQDAPTANEDLRFVKVTSDAVPTDAGIAAQTNITVAKQLASGGTFPARWISGTTAGFTIQTANNLMEAGSTLWLVSASALAGIDGFHIQVRWRSQY